MCVVPVMLIIASAGKPLSQKILYDLIRPIHQQSVDLRRRSISLEQRNCTVPLPVFYRSGMVLCLACPSRQTFA